MAKSFEELGPIENVVDKPADLELLVRLVHLPELVAAAREVNARLLMIERAGPCCAIGMRSSSVSTSPTTEGAREPKRVASEMYAPWP